MGLQKIYAVEEKNYKGSIPYVHVISPLTKQLESNAISDSASVQKLHFLSGTVFHEEIKTELLVDCSIRFVFT